LFIYKRKLHIKYLVMSMIYLGAKFRDSNSNSSHRQHIVSDSAKGKKH